MEVWRSAKILGRDMQFVMQMFVFSLMGGISFAVPAIQDVIFEDFDTKGGKALNADDCSWTNFSFILSGIVTGLTLGYFVKSPSKFGFTLKILFVQASLGLTGIAIISYESKSFEKQTLLFILLVLMGISGSGLLGFIGIGLASAVHQGHPAEHSYSGGAVEWFLQAFGALITQVATDANSAGFAISAGASWLVTLIFLFGYSFSDDYHDHMSDISSPREPFITPQEI